MIKKSFIIVEAEGIIRTVVKPALVYSAEA